MKWVLRSSKVPNTISELKQVMIENRGIADPQAFFAPRSPLELTLAEVGIDAQQMQLVLERLERAKANHEDVLIFGDYDADGICATAILWQALKAFGIVARPFIPHREKHGYGLSERSLSAVLAEKKPDVLITVDNGIVAHGPFAQLKALGVDAILTDHHQLEVDSAGQSLYPPAYAVLHSTKLCGSTVAWFLARELSEVSARSALDLTAVATIADQMPLVGANRSFAKFGLEALRHTERVGLQLLLAKAELNQATLTVSSINFGIAPRINAMGRLKHGLDALRLLCTQNVVKAEELVNELNETNTSRQELTSEMIAQALERAAEWENESIIIVESAEYHEGVIGLIAGKLMETFYKPAIVIAVNETMAKASARSVTGVNIIELIRLVKDDLLEAGGHPMAAGFALLPEKIEGVRERLQTLAKAQISQELLEPSIEVECMLGMHLASLKCLESIAEFAPFGQQNREPIFGLCQLKIIEVMPMGKEGKHLKLGLVNTAEPGQPLIAVGWKMSEWVTQLQPGMVVDVAGVLELNEWKGRKSLQLVLKDVHVPSA